MSRYPYCYFVYFSIKFTIIFRAFLCGRMDLRFLRWNNHLRLLCVAEASVTRMFFPSTDASFYWAVNKKAIPADGFIRAEGGVRKWRERRNVKTKLKFNQQVGCGWLG